MMATTDPSFWGKSMFLADKTATETLTALLTGIANYIVSKPNRTALRCGTRTIFE